MKKLTLLFAILIVATISLAQTAGIGYVTAIESKVATYIANTQQIEKYKAEAATLDSLWKQKANKLKTEIADLIKERDNLIADMKVGAKCSQCGKYKSEFEKEGKDFQKHLGDVKGYAVPATTDELEQTRKMFAERIAIKKVQLQTLEKGDNALTAKLNQIRALEEKNKAICTEITKDSKNYATKVLADGKDMHENWTSVLMHYATAILIAEDMIAISKDRIVRIERAFREESEKVKQRVKQENEKDQADRNARIEKNKLEIDEVEYKHAEQYALLKGKLYTALDEKSRIELQLKQSQLSDSLKTSLKFRLKDLDTLIVSIEKDITLINTTMTKRKTLLEGEIRKWRDEIFQLVSSLSNQQTKAVADIKPYYDQKKNETNQSVGKANNDLTAAKKTYSDKVNYYKAENQKYFNLIVSEEGRMIVASRKIDCTIWVTGSGDVMLNWNKVFPCVNSLTTMAKSSSSVVFNSYCPGKSEASYMSEYKSFLNGLGQEDKAAVRSISNATWFDLITN